MTTYTFSAPMKDPEAALDYEMDWSEWLEQGETISGVQVTSSDAALDVSNASTSDGKVLWRLTGGVASSDYFVTVQITTSSGQVDHRTVRVPVRNQ